MNSRDVEVNPPDADLPQSGLVHTSSPSLETEANFRYLFVINPLPMWVYDLQTLAFLEVNDAAVAIYGYSYDEFLGMRLTDIQLPDNGPYARVSTPKDFRR